jgi:uncharacterized protein YndB with AHSA1/START domain
MSKPATETLAVIVEREIPYPLEKIWRALTQPHLIEEWLMKNDFKPVVDHRFNLRADWGAVDCQVMAVEPNKTLSYTWAAYGLESVVTWTPAHGAVGLPAGSAAGLPGRQVRVAAVLCKPGAGLGARVGIADNRADGHDPSRMPVNACGQRGHSTPFRSRNSAPRQAIACDGISIGDRFPSREYKIVLTNELVSAN